MRVRAIQSFETKKGTIPEGTVINIPESLFDRFQGKVARIPPAETRQPMTDGRRETLEVVADAILSQAVRDIQAGGIWQSTPEIKVLEDEINRFHRLLMEGMTSLQTFRQAVERWKMTGTQILKH
jgi:hypothetical protein